MRGTTNGTEDPLFTPIEDVVATLSNDQARVGGVQSIARAAAILRVLGNFGPSGATLNQVSSATGLHKATAYRILRALAECRLAEYDSLERVFRLGFGVFSLNAAMGERFDLAILGRPLLEEITKATEDTAYLSVRSGYDGVCVAAAEGSYPRKALRLSVGDRWPLGVGATNLALLAYLPDSEIDEIMARNRPLLEGQDEYAPEKILEHVGETRARGYALKSSGVFPTMCGVGVPIVGTDNRPFAALSVIAIVPRMEQQRQEWIAELLWAGSKKLSDELQRGLFATSGATNWRPGSPRRSSGEEA